MNYVREINAFYDQQEINPLSASAIALWYALMHICNKAGWPANFSVAVSVLSIKSGLKERTVYLARNELKQKGYITFQSKRGNQSAGYQIRSLSAHFAGNHEDNYEHSSADNDVDNGEALVKQNKTKRNHQQEKESGTANPYVFYETNGFGTLSPLIAEDISQWLDGGYYDEAERIVVEAMKQAIFNNARSWKYVTRILIDWHNRKLKTIQDVKAYQDSWRTGKSNVAAFKPKSKGREANDRGKRHDSKDYSSYDFGF